MDDYEGFAPYELVEGTISKVKEVGELIWKDMNKVREIAKEVRETLKSQFHKMEMVDVPKWKIGAIDGSNSPPNQRMGWCFGTYCAVCYYNFPKKMDILSDSLIVPSASKLDRYLSLLRFKKEMELIIKGAPQTELLLVNGSTIPIFWSYRKNEPNNFEGYGDNPAFNDLIGELVDGQSSFYKEKVFPMLKKKVVVAIPEVSFSKYFIEKKLQYYGVPMSLSDQVLLSVVLEEGEYTDPIPYYSTLSKGDTERADRLHQEMKDFYLAYFKPKKDSPAIKVEFHKNHLEKYKDIIKVLMDHYDSLTKYIQPLWIAHSVSNMVSVLAEQTAEMTKENVVRRFEGADNKTLELIEHSFSPSLIAKTIKSSG